MMQTQIIGWAHNRSYYWGNMPEVMNDCKSNYDSIHNLDSTDIAQYYDTCFLMLNCDKYPFFINDDDPYNEPLNINTNTDIILSGFLENTSYIVEYYSTRTLEQIIDSTFTSDVNGDLVISVPPTDANNPDYAMVIYKEGSGYYNKNSRVTNFANKQFAGANEFAGVYNNNQISIMPNPSNDIFKITVNNVQNNSFKIEIYDITSRIVYSQDAGNQRNIINLSNQPNGIYYCKIITADNIFVNKLIKN